MTDESSNQEAALKSLDSLVDELATKFIGHPGFMWTSGGFEVLHADWPAYPWGHGFRAALASLAEYPSGTRFYQLDSIDYCSLFSAGRKPPSNVTNNASIFYVALWEEDLREGGRKKLFAGIGDEKEFLQFDSDSFSVTPLGHELILLFELLRRVHPTIFNRVEEFLYIRRYDAAVRESAILLETILRSASPEFHELNGRRLVDSWCEKMLKHLPQSFPHSAELELRAALRRFFTFVRNEFAHNLKDLDAVAMARLLTRSSALYQIVEGFSAGR